MNKKRKEKKLVCTLHSGKNVCSSDFFFVLEEEENEFEGMLGLKNLRQTKKKIKRQEK